MMVGDPHISLDPVADTFVWDNVRQNNQYSDQAGLEVEDAWGSEYDREAYLQFDLTAVRSAGYAELQLRPLQTLHYWEVVWHALELVDDDWQGLGEHELTWAQSRGRNLGGPVIAQWAFSGAAISAVEPIRINLGSYVQQSLDLGRDKISFRIRNVGEQYRYVQYGSREHSWASPKLIIHSTADPLLPTTTAVANVLPALAIVDRFETIVADGNSSGVQISGDVSRNDYHDSLLGTPTYELVGDDLVGLTLQPDGSFTYDGPASSDGLSFRYRMVNAGEESIADAQLVFIKRPVVKTIHVGDEGFSRSGSWISSGDPTDRVQLTSVNDTASATYAFDSLPAGRYQLAARWTAAASNPSSASYQVLNGPGEVASGWVDQTVAPVDDNGGFEFIGQPIAVESGHLALRWRATGSQSIVAGSIRLIPVKSEPDPADYGLTVLRWQEPSGATGFLRWDHGSVTFRPDPARGLVHLLHPDGSEQVILTGTTPLELIVEQRATADQTLPDHTESFDIDPTVVTVLAMAGGDVEAGGLHFARLRIDDLTESLRQNPGDNALTQRLIEATNQYVAIDYHTVATSRIAAAGSHTNSLSGHIVKVVSFTTTTRRQGAEFEFLPDYLQIFTYPSFAFQPEVHPLLVGLPEDVLSPVVSATNASVIPDSLKTSRVDLTLPAIGFPATMQRSYDSESDLSMGLGAGWSHNNGAYLERFFGTHDFILHDGDGGRRPFSLRHANGDQLSFGSPNDDDPAIIIREHRSVGGVWGLYWTLTDQYGNQQVFDNFRHEHSRLAERSDRNGNRHALTYDTSGRLHQLVDITQTEQPVVRLTYQMVGNRIESILSDDGRQISYRYGGDQRRLIGVTLHDAAATSGTTQVYQYGSRGGSKDRLVSTTIDGDPEMAYAYTPSGRLRSITDRSGQSIPRRYDDATRTLLLSDATGIAHRQQFDDQKRMIRSTDPLGLSAQFTYDTSHRINSQTGPNGQPVHLTHDERGNVIERRIGEVVERLFYDPVYSTPLRQIRTAGEQSSVVMEQQIDDRGNVLLHTDVAGVRTARYPSQSLE